MSTRPRPFWLLLVPLVSAHGGTPFTKGAEDDTLQNPSIRRLYSELRILFRRHYPEATSHLLKDKMHFEHNTRIFVVHEPLKTGEWQDPFETRGPNPGGILCDITFQKGRYMGAAMVPQTFDKRYFKVALMAPYSEKHDAHLHVLLFYPEKTSSDFLREFIELVNNFEKHLD